MAATTKFQSAAKWIFQEKHQAKARELRDDVERAFTDHPREVNESYLQHLWFTTQMSMRFAYASLAIFIHGIFPFLCVRTGSSQIKKLHAIMQTRIPKSTTPTGPDAYPAGGNEI